MITYRMSLKRGFAITLIIALSCESFAYAAPVMPASQNPPVMSMPGMPIGIHESVASVEDFYNAGGSFLAGNLPAARASGKLVYLLQDAHTNSSAQFNTSKTLEWLFKKKKGALKYIFLEAGAGDESLGGLRRFSDLGHRRRVALSYLMQGQLQGSEYFNLTTDEDAVLFGVEDMRLYRQSLVVYRAAAGRRDRFYAYLNKTTAAIDKLKKALFNPLLFTFDAKYQEVRQGGLSWTNYYDAMTRQSQSLGISLRDYPRLKALDRLSRFEKRIDFKKANLEQARAWESLDSQKREAFGFVSRQTLENSCAAAKDTGESAFLSYLEENLAGALKQYPNLSGYIQYRKMAHQLLTHSMQKEEKRLRQQILQALCVNADEASLLKADENIDALKKLLRLSLVPDEFGDYQDNYAAFDMRRMSGFINEKLMSLRDYYADAVFLEPGFEAIVKKCEAFYRLTRQRDASFVRTMLGRMDKAGQSQAVLVTGGYHMPNLKRLLKEQGVSYVCLTPRVYQETDQKRYEKLLLGQHLKTTTSDTTALASGEASRPAGADTQMLTRIVHYDPFLNRAEFLQKLNAGMTHLASAGARMSQDSPLQTFEKINDEAVQSVKRALAAAFDRVSQNTDGDYTLETVLGRNSALGHAFAVAGTQDEIDRLLPSGTQNRVKISVTFNRSSDFSNGPKDYIKIIGLTLHGTDSDTLQPLTDMAYVFMKAVDGLCVAPPTANGENRSFEWNKITLSVTVENENKILALLSPVQKTVFYTSHETGKRDLGYLYLLGHLDRVDWATPRGVEALKKAPEEMLKEEADRRESFLRIPIHSWDPGRQLKKNATAMKLKKVVSSSTLFAGPDGKNWFIQTSLFGENEPNDLFIVTRYFSMDSHGTWKYVDYATMNGTPANTPEIKEVSGQYQYPAAELMKSKVPGAKVYAAQLEPGDVIRYVGGTNSYTVGSAVFPEKIYAHDASNGGGGASFEPMHRVIYLRPGTPPGPDYYTRGESAENLRNYGRSAARLATTALHDSLTQLDQPANRVRAPQRFSKQPAMGEGRVATGARMSWQDGYRFRYGNELKFLDEVRIGNYTGYVGEITDDLVYVSGKKFPNNTRFRLLSTENERFFDMVARRMSGYHGHDDASDGARLPSKRSSASAEMLAARSLSRFLHQRHMSFDEIVAMKNQIQVILLCGNDDLHSILEAYDLFIDKKVGQWMLLSGGTGRLTESLMKTAKIKGLRIVAKTEAGIMRQILVALAKNDRRFNSKQTKEAVEKIRRFTILETKSTYTIQNLDNSKKKLRGKGLIRSDKKLGILYMGTPSQQRRTTGLFENVFAREIQSGWVRGYSYATAFAQTNFEGDGLGHTAELFVTEMFRIVAYSTRGNMVLRSADHQGLKAIPADLWTDLDTLSKALPDPGAFCFNLINSLSGLDWSVHNIYASEDLPLEAKNFVKWVKRWASIYESSAVGTRMAAPRKNDHKVQIPATPTAPNARVVSPKISPQHGRHPDPEYIYFTVRAFDELKKNGRIMIGRVELSVTFAKGLLHIEGVAQKPLVIRDYRSLVKSRFFGDKRRVLGISHSELVSELSRTCLQTQKKIRSAVDPSLARLASEPAVIEFYLNGFVTRDFPVVDQPRLLRLLHGMAKRNVLTVLKGDPALINAFIARARTAYSDVFLYKESMPLPASHQTAPVTAIAAGSKDIRAIPKGRRRLLHQDVTANSWIAYEGLLLTGELQAKMDLSKASPDMDRLRSSYEALGVTVTDIDEWLDVISGQQNQWETILKYLVVLRPIPLGFKLALYERLMRQIASMA